MQIRVLGPVEVLAAGGPVALAPAKRRLLALLVARAGQPQSVDVLADALWNGRPPATAPKVVQLYVSQLRRELRHPETIQTVSDGYVLELPEGVLDAQQFELSVKQAQATALGNDELTVVLLTRGLELWRGAAYGEFAGDEALRPDAERLEELRLVAFEQRADAQLRLGLAAEVVVDLQQLVHHHPLRERFRAQLMVALYAGGRQSEALDVYRAARDMLQRELGVEPGPELRDTHRRVLRQDAAPVVAPNPRRDRAELPAPPSSLIGREEEVRELCAQLLDRSTRLLTIAGPGGSGKTRLALTVGQAVRGAFANGVVFVDLASVQDADAVPMTLARAIGVVPTVDDLADAVARALQPLELLIIVDNLEQVRTAAGYLVELLHRAPRVRMLATSRTVLRVRGEHVYSVPPLGAPDAARLFQARAVEAGASPAPAQDDPAVVELCRRLDQLPLAIELAAGWTRTLTPAELLSRYAAHLPGVGAGGVDVPERQRTLHATLDWSAALLDRRGQRDLARLSVFVGGCGVDAAAEVCETTVDGLAVLVDHHLVQRSSVNAQSRFTMLDTVRQYAAERLNSEGETERMRARHLRWAAQLAREANLYAEAEGRQRFDLVLPEAVNLRAALAWAAAGRSRAGLDLAVSLENFWVTHGPTEGVRILSELLVGPEVDDLLRARALRVIGGCRFRMADHVGAEAAYSASLRIFERQHDDRGVAILSFRRGVNLIELGDAAAARPLIERSRREFEALGSRRGQAQAVGALGSAARAVGDLETARPLLERSAELSATLGRSWWQVRMLLELADVALAAGDPAEADRQARAALELARAIGDRESVVRGLAAAAVAALRLDEVSAATRLWETVLAAESSASLPEWTRRRPRYVDALGALLHAPKTPPGPAAPEP